MISVVIPSCSNDLRILSVLHSLEEQSLPTTEYETLVVFNGSSQKAQAKVSSLPWKMNLKIFEEQDKGVNAARNRGLQKAAGDVVLFLDDDCRPLFSTHLEQHLSLHENLPHAAALGGPYLIPQKSSALVRAYHAFADHWFHQSHQKNRLLGGNVSYKKNRLVEKQLVFDPSIVFGSSENELHQRMVQHGLTLIQVDLPVLHESQVSFLQFIKKAYLQGYHKALYQIRDDSPPPEIKQIPGSAFLSFAYHTAFNFGVRRGRSCHSKKPRFPSLSFTVDLYNFLLKGMYWKSRPLLNRTYWISHYAGSWMYWRVYERLSRLYWLIHRLMWRAHHFFRHTYAFNLTKSMDWVFGISAREYQKFSFTLNSPSYFLRPGATPPAQLHTLFDELTIPWNPSENSTHLFWLHNIKLKTLKIRLLLSDVAVVRATDQYLKEILAGASAHLIPSSSLNCERAARRLEKLKIPFQIFYVIQDLSNALRPFEKWPQSRSAQIEYWAGGHHTPSFQSNFSFARELSFLFKTLSKQNLSSNIKLANVFAPHAESQSSSNHLFPMVEMMLDTSQAALPRHSFVIPVNCTQGHYFKVLKNLARINYSRNDYEVVVVDDGNPTPLAPLIQAHLQKEISCGFQIRVLRWSRTEGDGSYRAGPARNVGLAFARGQRIFFLDSDIILNTEVLNLLDREESSTVIQLPRLMLNKTSSQKKTYFDEYVIESDTYQQDGYWEHFNSSEWHTLRNHWKYTCTYALSIPRLALALTGPFRSDYTEYGFEDVDLGYRLHLTGAKFKLLASPALHLYPDETISFHFDKAKRFDSLSKSASVFLRRNLNLDFYWDLFYFLRPPFRVVLLKPYYFLAYQANKRLFKQKAQYT